MIVIVNLELGKKIHPLFWKNILYFLNFKSFKDDFTCDINFNVKHLKKNN